MKIKPIAMMMTIALLSCASHNAWAEPGVTQDTITFGQIAAVSGPAGSLGTEMRRGVLAAFEEANVKGGVKGRKLALVTEDDGYEPKNTLPIATKMADEGKVFALVGSVGTPTTLAIMPLLEEKNLLLVGPVTGAEALRAPYTPHIVNVRASYNEETELMVDHLVKDINAKKIAVFYQNDGFGKAGLTGVNKALAKRNLAAASEGTFERNTIAVKDGLSAVMKAEPDAIVIIAPYAPSAVFTKMARKEGYKGPLLNVSFVGTSALSTALAAGGEDVYITQIVPDPTDIANPLVAHYQAALKKSEASAKFGHGSLEGYLVGRFVVAALEKTVGELTQEKFRQAITSAGAFDIDGFPLTYGPNDNHGSHAVFLSRTENGGRVVSVSGLK